VLRLHLGSADARVAVVRPPYSIQVKANGFAVISGGVDSGFNSTARRNPTGGLSPLPIIVEAHGGSECGARQALSSSRGIIRAESWDSNLNDASRSKRPLSSLRPALGVSRSQYRSPVHGDRRIVCLGGCNSPLQPACSTRPGSRLSPDRNGAWKSLDALVETTA